MSIKTHRRDDTMYRRVEQGYPATCAHSFTRSPAHPLTRSPAHAPRILPPASSVMTHATERGLARAREDHVCRRGPTRAVHRDAAGQRPTGAGGHPDLLRAEHAAVAVLQPPRRADGLPAGDGDALPD